jgi:hypothetical protein
MGMIRGREGSLSHQVIFKFSFYAYIYIMERKIAKVVNHVKMDDEDTLDVLFWRSKA